MERMQPAINLSLFTTFSSPPNPTKSPRSFENGVVGLGIVAAMTNFSDKLSVVSCAKATANFRTVLNLERENGVCDDNQVDGLDCDDVDDDGESYTCVISHVGDKLISKRVYFGDRMNDGCGVFDVNVVIGDVKEEFVSEGFLTSCDLCKKLLQGLDIFMYRGENAFCSLECREKHIRNDYKEKCGSEARKSLDYSVSPRSSPLTFFAGVVAA